MYKFLSLKNTFSNTKNIFGNPTYIVAAKRTPIGTFLGKLSTFTAVELGAIASKAALESIKLDGKNVDEVILGNVCAAGLGQAPARQVSIKAGLPSSVPCITINKVCSSGMKSVIFGAQSIGLGQSNIVLAGGFESMSNVPFYVNNVSYYLFSTEKDLPLDNKSLLMD
jgi:acetyl-CoA C-acetyltransferase